LLARRARVIAPVPEDMRDLYDRIAKRHHGTALAEARDGQCRGCGLRVLPHILQLLKSEADEEIYRCESCGLILYSLEPIPPIAKPGPSSADAASSASTPT
jgi:predicted  nucleic acid-binding Zn-ribbon protein